MQISEFQRLIEQTYGERDRARGLPKTFMWFTEEVGELSRALHRNERLGATRIDRDRAPAARDAGDENLRKEFADVFAWLTTLASASGVDLEAVAVEVYGKGCPDCGDSPCSCD